jgi:hypothetical protein
MPITNPKAMFSLLTALEKGNDVQTVLDVAMGDVFLLPSHPKPVYVTRKLNSKNKRRLHFAGFAGKLGKQDAMELSSFYL